MQRSGGPPLSSSALLLWGAWRPRGETKVIQPHRLLRGAMDRGGEEEERGIEFKRVYCSAASASTHKAHAHTNHREGSLT